MNEQSPTPNPASIRVTHVMRTASTSIERRAHLAAARYLMRHCDERAIVVVDDITQEPAGVITENNVDRALALGHDLNEVRIADISTKAPLSVESAASVRDAATAMLCHGVRYLPVVDQGRLVGIVCLRDLRRQLPKPGPTMTNNAAERVAIVTGGSGGIGQVAAERLAGDGVTDFRGDPSKIGDPVPVMQRDQDRILPPEHNAALLDFPN